MGMRIITFKIDQKLLDRLEELASEWGVPRSQVIRDAIRAYVSRYGGKPENRVRWRVKYVRLG